MLFSRYIQSMHARLPASGCALTIGGFDGIHLGHQALLAAVRSAGDRLAVPALVMSFEPTPKEYFAAAEPPPRLMRFRDRYEAFRRAGMDGFFCPRFDAGMAALTAGQFIDDLLVDGLRVRHLVIGDDFRFGAGGKGGVADLLNAGGRRGFAVQQIDSVYVDGRRVSSTLVRDALDRGELDVVRRMLGRDYRISGRVVRGEQLGRTLGYPTANIRLHRRRSPVHGIFAVRVHGVGDGPVQGVASVGTRPTVNGTGTLLEVHLFDVDANLYGRRIAVDFVAKLRDEEKFDSLDALVEQMRRDEAAARAALAAAGAAPASGAAAPLFQEIT
jgi:riboflavin kinase/FMN adenylyltransferase